jgi:hypothetical protein
MHDRSDGARAHPGRSSQFGRFPLCLELDQSVPVLKQRLIRVQPGLEGRSADPLVSAFAIEPALGGQHSTGSLDLLETKPHGRIQRLVVRDDPIADHVGHGLYIYPVTQMPPLVGEESGHRGSLRPRAAQEQPTGRRFGSEAHHPCWRGSEAASIDIERSQVRLEVDMQVLAPCFSGRIPSRGDQLRSNPATALGR